MHWTQKNIIMLSIITFCRILNTPMTNCILLANCISHAGAIEITGICDCEHGASREPNEGAPHLSDLGNHVVHVNRRKIHSDGHGLVIEKPVEAVMEDLTECSGCRAYNYDALSRVSISWSHHDTKVAQFRINVKCQMSKYFVKYYTGHWPAGDACGLTN